MIDNASSSLDEKPVILDDDPWTKPSACHALGRIGDREYGREVQILI